MENISGVVERITFHNEENGFAVIKLKTRGEFEPITVVGNIGMVNVGAVLSIKGDWKIDSKFGKQLVATEYRETLPATVTGIQKYLGSGLIKGIGPVYAKKIVAYFKEDTLNIIETFPDRLSEISGIGPNRVKIIKEAWKDQKEIKNIMIFLQGHGVSTGYSVKIYKTYGEKSVDIVMENPYKLADDIWGIGFKTADSIARKLGIETESIARIRSGILYSLSQLSNEGHCYSGKEDLFREAASILELEEVLLHPCLQKMIENKDVINDKDIINDKDGIFIPPLFYSEKGVAARIKKILEGISKFNSDDFEQLITIIQTENNIKYDQIQIDAVREALLNKFMVLTGGPGTGKTTTTKAIIKAFVNQGATILLAAPTGRAAKRMSETTGMESKTIHRLLEYSPLEGYKKNENNKLECDILIIDECSMIDIVLMYSLLKAVPDDSNVIMVGDVDQLPSVGPGNVLKDVIESGIIAVVKLSSIFRQAQGSLIITNAHKINTGKMPIFSNDRESDFFFMEAEDNDKTINTIKELCKSRLPSYYKVNSIEDIQVLCPMQRGDLGARNLNNVLQQALNPEQSEIRYGGIIYKKGDKVMQIKNNYDKSVFNGDIGRIVEIDKEDNAVLINFDGNDVDYDISEMDEVILAYATTIHKSQGSEYQIVIAPVSTSHYVMLQRNLLYTCVTRAKKILILVGSKKAIAMALKNDKISRRNTMLQNRLKGF